MQITPVHRRWRPTKIETCYPLKKLVFKSGKGMLAKFESYKIMSLLRFRNAFLPLLRVFIKIIYLSAELNKLIARSTLLRLTIKQSAGFFVVQHLGPLKYLWSPNFWNFCAYLSVFSLWANNTCPTPMAPNHYIHSQN